MTPWFGNWPPELRGVSEMEKGNKDITVWARLFRLSWLLAITIICFLLICVLQPLYVGFQILLATIGSTSLVVFLLGGTVDWWLKQAILEDVFKAAVGYLLPAELKPAMEWVYQQDIIAIKHRQTVKLSLYKDDLVLMRVAINRTFQNISQHTAKLRAQLSIDEWFHKERESQIIEFGWPRSEDFERQRRGNSLSIKITEENEIELAPRATVDIWFTYEEVKHANDQHIDTFLHPTSSLFVEVEAFEGLNISVGVFPQKQRTLKSVGINKYELTGTLLPGQPIHIRWYRVGDSEKWLNRNEPNLAKGV